MDMMIGISTATLLVACVVSVVLCVLLYFRCVDLECEVDVVQESKDAMRESMSNTNYSLHQVIERLKREKHAQRKKLRAEITQALKEKGKYRFDSKTDKGYEGLRLNDGELYELLKPFLRKGYFVKSHTDRFINLNNYFEVSKHRGSYSEIWGVTEADLEHVL